MTMQLNSMRIKFGKKPEPAYVRSLILWASVFDVLWMAPYVKGKGSAGNMGFRKNQSICVTASGSRLGSLKTSDIMTITDILEDREHATLFFYGDCTKKPTREALIYWDIFKKRPDVNVILHGHDLLVLDNVTDVRKVFPDKISATRTITEAGSAELRHQIMQILTDKTQYLLARGHGFFALGATFEEAGMVALKIRQATIGLILGKNYMGALRKRYEIA